MNPVEAEADVQSSGSSREFLFDPGYTGLEVEPTTGVVKCVDKGSQGDRYGVRAGWRISKTYGIEFTSQSLQPELDLLSRWSLTSPCAVVFEVASFSHAAHGNIWQQPYSVEQAIGAKEPEGLCAGGNAPSIDHGERMLAEPSFTIAIHTLGGAEIKLPCQVSDTVSDIRTSLVQKLGNDAMRFQELFLGCKRLEDETTLKHLGITEGSVLTMVRKRVRLVTIPIVVKSYSAGGLDIRLEVSHSDTVGEVKSMIFEKCGVPVEEQCLIFGGKVMLDSHNLERYNISFNNVIARIPQV